MHRLVLILVLAAVTQAAACPERPVRQLTAAHAAAIRDSAQATLDAFLRYSAGGQWDSLAALYDDGPDFRWLEQGTLLYRSAAGIRQAMARVRPTTRIETSHFDSKIVPLAPGVASVATAFHTKFVDARNPAGVEFGGVITMVLVHREEGWRIVVGHTSSPGASR